MRIFKKIDTWVINSVSVSQDDKETLLRKKIWWWVTITWAFFAIFDFFITRNMKHKNLAILDAIEFPLCIILLVTFTFYRKKVENYGLITQLIIVIFPSIKVYMLGGIFSSAGIATVGLIGPIYALTFTNHRRALLIFLFYLGLIHGGTILSQYLSNPEILQDSYFRYSLVRYTGALCLIFFLTYAYSLHFARLKQIEEERLIQLHNAKSKLYSNITHEFRTPLTVILGMADNLENNTKELINKGVELIKSNANKLLKLVNQLLNMSKIEADSMPVKKIQSDIISFIKYIVESFNSYADEKNIRLHFLPEMENLLMDFDSGIIEDILSNLLSNAIKFTPEKGNIYIQIETESIINKNYSEKLILKVKDTGIGIPEEKLTNIFERFYQIDDESTRKAEGSGIGLALVKEYIQILKGKIEVKSKINQGTEFIIELPINKEAPKEKLNYKKFKEYSESELDLFDTEEEYNTENPEEIKNGKPIVLIIEDNNDVIEYLKSIINKDYQTEIANNGDIGIKKALKNIPDIIICDVMMPEKDGYEVCKTLKEDFRTNHIPIIMLTAKADSDSKLNGLEYGADAYIVKPFNKKELLIRLQKLIELRQTLKEKYSDVVNSNFKPENPKGLNEVFLQKLLESLGQNYQDESYSIDKLCIDTAVSRAQLHRKLIVLTGKSTTDFIRHYRIKKAKELLINPEPSVSEVAYNVGFKDPNYFTKSFIKETGITPSQYRAKNLIMQQ